MHNLCSRGKKASSNHSKKKKKERKKERSDAEKRDERNIESYERGENRKQKIKKSKIIREWVDILSNVVYSVITSKKISHIFQLKGLTLPLQRYFSLLSCKIR